MKKFDKARALLLSICMIAVGQAGASPPPRQQALPLPAYVEGELLIKVGPNSGPDALAGANLVVGADEIQNFDFIGWHRVRLPEALSVAEAIAAYSQLDGVASAQPNYIYRTSVFPNDSMLGALYGMTKIAAPAAWDATTGSPSVVVAVLDTGVRLTHEDLAANIWHNSGEVAGNGVDDDANGFVDDVSGYDFKNDDSDPSDDNRHGTHVTGTIGAIGNNSLGVVGVNWAVKLMALKTHDAAGNSTAATVISAFQYVTMMKNRGVNIRVTSNSWGGAPEAPAYDQALKDAIDAAGNAGIVNVFAAGNDTSDNDVTPAYPASYTSPSIIAVAASDSSDQRAFFSNYGASAVDLAAPGSGILSTDSVGDSSYRSLSGTSMAAPHVAGAVALVAAADPSLSAQSLKATILNTVDALPQWSGVVLTGGRLNVAQAIQSHTVCSFTVDAPDAYFAASGGSATVSITSPSNCGWAIAGKPGWITIASQGTGAGGATITYTVVANTTGTSRQAQMTLAGTSFSVVQDGGAIDECRVAASLGQKTFGAGGGGGIISIKAGPRCGWQATANASWITFNSSSVGVGDRALGFAVAANAGGQRRKATVKVGGVSFTIKQKGN